MDDMNIDKTVEISVAINETYRDKKTISLNLLSEFISMSSTSERISIFYIISKKVFYT